MSHIYSMTGFGKAISHHGGKKFTVEIKSLNSKQADLNLRMPSFYKSKEADIRKILSDSLQRGKIDFNLYCEVNAADKAPRINENLVKEYMLQLQRISREAGVEGDIIAAVMRLPEVLVNPEDEIEKSEWLEIKSTVESAVAHLMEFRHTEGQQLLADVKERLLSIQDYMQQMGKYEEDRMLRLKNRLLANLEEIGDKLDKNRFEQELIYYLEKLDITEEKVRLKSHLDYFTELLDKGGMIGKKLGFISQEMGREINTMGSKASHAEMQKLVVGMKDELEKIKEQVLNIL